MIDFPSFRTRANSDRWLIRLVLDSFIESENSVARMMRSFIYKQAIYLERLGDRPSDQMAGSDRRRETVGVVVEPELRGRGDPIRAVAILQSLTVLNGVTAIVQFGPFRDKALPAFLTSAPEQITSCLGLHTRTKPVLAFSAALGRLISPFHRFSLFEFLIP